MTRSGYIHGVMLSRAPAWGVFALTFLCAGPAFADRLVLLPSQGSAEASMRAALDVDLSQGAVSLGHAAASDVEARAALTRVSDGSADTPEEYAAVANFARVSWVLSARAEPSGGTLRVEIAAYLASLGRVESVVRDVNRSRQAVEVREMLAVLLRPEGIGVGALPWEQAPQPQPQPQPPPPPFFMPPPQPPPPLPPVDSGKVSMSYLGGETLDVWPPYSAGKRGFVGALVGFSSAVSAPSGSTGGSSGFVGGLRAGYAFGDAGLEVFADLGGNLFGPRALWFDVGGRWLFSPLVRREPDGRRTGFSVHVGPELLLGPFARLGTDVTLPSGVTYEAEGSTHFSFGAALDVVLGVSPSLRIDAQLGNLRIVPTDEGVIVLMGATAGASYRF